MPDPGAPAVAIDGSRVAVRHLVVDDPDLAELLRAQPAEDHPGLLARVLSVGARGLLTMGVGIDVAAIDARVNGTLERAVEDAERRMGELIEAGRQAFAASFDPQQRTSLLARAMDDFTAWRDGLLTSLDPGGADSHTTRFLAKLTDLLGPEGALEERLRGALDPDADGSALARFAGSIDDRFSELRDLIVFGQGRAVGRDEEAARGTAQGIDFEDVVEVLLRAEAAAFGGVTVERVSRTPGALGPRAAVGDFVLTLADGRCIVVEAKNQAALTLAGREGILGELDRAMDNRNADFAVCVSGRDAFPAEVGSFGVYGDRVLVVDEGEGTMLRVALRWAVAALGLRSGEQALDFDPTALADRLSRIRTLADRFRTMQSTLTSVGRSVDSVRETLREMRVDLIDLVDDARREIGRVSGS
jgi:hypothetical protein